MGALQSLQLLDLEAYYWDANQDAVLVQSALRLPPRPCPWDQTAGPRVARDA